nr:TM0106 family RecB-like putative nuclease [Specibacter cremeus]
MDPVHEGAESDLIFSASDLVIASDCDYQSLRILDEKLGRTPKADFAPDAMLERAARLGDAHEAKVLRELVKQYGDWNPTTGRGVKIVDRAEPTRAALGAKRDETLAALRNGADVVFQATFFDGEFVGFADFLVRQTGGDYAVWDTKLARHAKVSALLQLAAYGDQLLQYGITPAPVTTLVLGDRSRSDHPMADLLPVFRERRDRFKRTTAAHRSQPHPVEWGLAGETGVAACGRCDYCAEQVAAHRDLLLVNGMTPTQRRKLIGRGITTIEALAGMPAGNAPASNAAARLRDQARMQLGLDEPEGTRTFSKDGQSHTVSFKVLPGHDLATLPKPSDGDIFFDFEGDPLWQDPDDQSWGIEYLFGSIEAPDSTPGEPERFTPFWAHSRAQERKAFLAFLAYVEGRRAQYPDMHVYHYAPYEKSALRNLSLRHTTGEDTVDRWLREGLLVDLLPVVKHSIRISESSYSIKKLEPLYMGEHLRTGEVKDAGASVVAYAEYCAARDDGRAEEAAAILASISDYNEYDCLSTLRLRDWLLALAATHPVVEPGPVVELVETSPVVESDESVVELVETVTPEEQRLRAFLDDLASRNGHVPTNDERAIAMVAAAAGYHRRENKQFWWGHFDRLEAPVEDWAEQRDVFVVDHAEVVEDWAKATPKSRTETRTLELTGTMADGSDFRPRTTWFGMMTGPLPVGLEHETNPLARGGLFNTTVQKTVDNPRNPAQSILTVTQKSTLKVPPHDHLPLALTPDQPISTRSIEAALAELANEVGGLLPALPRHPGVEILRKAHPRLADDGTLPAVVVGADGAPDYIGAITEAVARLDRSYLAVQGPPGTGKTHVGSHVIAALVARGWKVGVVGQSHAVVENMLRAAIGKAGVDPSRVGKKLAAPHEVPWKVTDDKRFEGLLLSAEGALIGGTAWTMTGANVPAGSLDLLVIDEAGQYSLANTLAVSRSARRLLLLGDPQQLPQVTQGTHPEPVDESALGWLSAGHATLPSELGYFLADSWRMHPVLCDAVSKLSYDGRLESAPAAGLRHLAGAPAGVEAVLVPHEGNSTSSREEAAEVVAQARRHVGLAWTPGPGAASRPLGPDDVLVVAAYNAQVHLVRAALDAAGLSGVRVGTVDKFQGQEAPVVLVTMACSSAAEAPRGMEFLLNRNRINVAVSRGQWRAVIIRSPGLTNFMPTKPSGLAELGAFIGLCN